MNHYSKKLKTLLTEDLPENEFSGKDSRNTFSNPQKQVHQQLAGTVKQFGQNPRASNNIMDSTPQYVSNLPKGAASGQANAAGATLLTGFAKNVLGGEATRKRLAEEKFVKQAEYTHEKTEGKIISATLKSAIDRSGVNNFSPRNWNSNGAGIGARNINETGVGSQEFLAKEAQKSQEELWYPVTFAQRKKEQEEREWVANNPNASAAELFYPSMRKASPAANQSAKQNTTQIGNQAVNQAIAQNSNMPEAVLAENTEHIGAVRKGAVASGAKKGADSILSDLSKILFTTEAMAGEVKNVDKVNNENTGKNSESPTSANSSLSSQYQVPSHSAPLLSVDNDGLPIVKVKSSTLPVAVANSQVVENGKGGLPVQEKSQNLHNTEQGILSHLVQSNNNNGDINTERNSNQSIYNNSKIIPESIDVLAKNYGSFSEKIEESSNRNKILFNYGFSTTPTIQVLGIKVTKPKEANPFEKTLCAAGGILGDILEAAVLTAATAYVTPVGAGAVVATAAGIAVSIVAEVSKELYNQHQRGEGMDFSKALEEPFKGGVASAASAMAVKKMEPLFKMLKKLPYEEAQIVLTEIGKFATELAASVGVNAAFKGTLPTGDDIMTQGMNQGQSYAATSLGENALSKFLGNKTVTNQALVKEKPETLVGQPTWNNFARLFSGKSK